MRKLITIILTVAVLITGTAFAMDCEEHRILVENDPAKLTELIALYTAQANRRMIESSDMVGLIRTCGDFDNDSSLSSEQREVLMESGCEGYMTDKQRLERSKELFQKRAAAKRLYKLADCVDKLQDRMLAEPEGDQK
jgi:hypothetical protein